MSATNGTALVVVPATANTASASTQLEPATAEQAFWLASQLFKSGVLGKNITKPEAAFAVILAGRELGLTAMQSLRSCYVVDGKVSMSADLILALVKRSPHCKSFKLIESSSEVATYEADRVGEGTTRMSFTMKEAEKAGLNGKDNWRKYPQSMLRARCIAALGRVVFPDVLLGIYEDDEIAPERGASYRADTPIAPVIVRPVAEVAPPAVAAPGVDTEVVEYWEARFDAATTAEEVKAIGDECKRGLPICDANVATLAAISVPAKKAKARCEGK